MTATRGSAANHDKDVVERVSSRPDFMAVMCVAWNGESESPFSEQLLQALGTLEHLEVYPTGGHSAFNVGDPSAEGRDWPDKHLPWLRNNQLLP